VADKRYKCLLISLKLTVRRQS